MNILTKVMQKIANFLEILQEARQLEIDCKRKYRML